MTVIRTDRLVLRPFEIADIPAYAAIRRQPGVTRYLPSHSDDPVQSDRRAASNVQAFVKLWLDPGYGPWAVVADGQLIGHAGLRWIPEEGATEVLYLLAPSAHGKGYASEAGRAALDYGFKVLGLERIVAWAMPENTASIAVMKRIGMRRRPGLVTVFGIQAVEYSITPEMKMG